MTFNVDFDSDLAIKDVAIN